MTSFSIPDMSCGHCKAAVERAIASVDPSARVEVDLAARSARVASDATAETFLKALAEAGYPATPGP